MPVFSGPQISAWKEIANRAKKQPTELEEILATIYLISVKYPEYLRA
jgi:hypothetical protein